MEQANKGSFALSLHGSTIALAIQKGCQPLSACRRSCLWCLPNLGAMPGGDGHG
jgi:hypothetical protein